MRMSFRLVLSLVLTVTLISILFALYQVRADTRSRRSDLEKRAQVLAESLQETVEPLWMKGARGSLRRIVERFGNRERLDGVALYDANGRPILLTARAGPPAWGIAPPPLDGSVFEGRGWSHFFGSGHSAAH